MKNRLFQYFSSLPPWARGVALVFVVGVTITLFILIRKGILKAINKANLNKTFKDDYTTLTNQGQTPSYPETTYLNLADKIEGGAQGTFGLGTDEEAIYDAFKEMKNDLDVILLEKAFGERTAPDCYFNCPALKLGAFLTNDLSAEEVAEINKILSAKAITIKF